MVLNYLIQGRDFGLNEYKGQYLTVSWTKYITKKRK